MGGSGDGAGGDIFGEVCRKEIGNILGVLSDERFPDFWHSLRTECLKIHSGIATSPNSFKRYAPFDATLTQRVKWLDANVLKPIERLENALRSENDPHFRHWEEYGDCKPLITGGFLTELSALKAKAQNLSEWMKREIDGENAGKIAHTNEIRSYIVYIAIDAVRDHFPDIKLSRGNWDNKLKVMEGRTPAYVRRVFLETTGRHEALDSKIADFI